MSGIVLQPAIAIKDECWCSGTRVFKATNWRASIAGMGVGAHSEPIGPGQQGAEQAQTASGGEMVAARPRRRRRLGWYATFIALAVAAIIGVSYLTGFEVLAASGRFLWNALAAVANSAARAAGGLLAMLARGVGWRRLTRLSGIMMGVGLSYAGGVILSDRGVRRARGWRGKLRLLLATMRKAWLDLPLPWKLGIVAALIAGQVYLHVVLIIFPIAFLVPVVRRVWVQTADLLFGSWYWTTFGRAHRRFVAALRGLPLVRHMIGGTRLARMRYLTAWRLWKYHPRYRLPGSDKRRIDLIEPLRLWRRGGLDGYADRPLLSRRRPAGSPAGNDPGAAAE